MTETDGRIATLESALDAAVQMIEELAADFTQHREETRRLFTEPAPEGVTPIMLRAEVARLEEMIAGVGRNVDPIAAFRARLRGDVAPPEPQHEPEPVATTPATVVATGRTYCTFCGQQMASMRGLRVHLHGCTANPERDIHRQCAKCGRDFVRLTPFMNHVKFCKAVTA